MKYMLQKRLRNRDMVVIGFGLVLILIALLIGFIAQQQGSPERLSPTPTIAPPPLDTTSMPRGHFINYDVEAGQRLHAKLIEKPPLSNPDRVAKNNTLVIILHGIESGVVYESSIVRVEYVKSLDIFMAEIITTDISKAKAETSTWFRNQGFTQKGICDLPIMFYLNPSVTEQLSGKPIIFSPLPNGC